MAKINVGYLDLRDILTEYKLDQKKDKPMDIISFCNYIFKLYQPERLSEKTRKGCDSLNSLETKRDRSEEIDPPRNRS